MSAGGRPYLTGRADTTDFEPLMIDGDQIGEAHWLRPEGSHGNPHEALLWRTDAPARYEYLFEGDESFQVLEGSARSSSSTRVSASSSKPATSRRSRRERARSGRSPSRS